MTPSASPPLEYAFVSWRHCPATRILGEGVKNPPEVFPMYRRKGIKGNERVLCFSADDGRLLWKHEYDCPYTVSYPLGPRTTPVVKDGKVYTLGTEGHLLCLDAGTGKVKWGRDLRRACKVRPPTRTWP